jgi:hypothetical protein
MIHLPDDLREPDSVAVVCAGTEDRVWTALYMARALLDRYGGDRLHALAAERDRELLSTVVPGGNVHPLPGEAEGLQPDAWTPALAFHPYSGVTLEDAVLLASLGCPVVSGVEHPVVSLAVRTPPDLRLPEAVDGMARLLDMHRPDDWMPRVPRNDAARAEALLAPVSGHMMPYIAATAGAARRLDRAGVEVPLKMVTLDGDDSPVAGEKRAVRAAVVAGAKAVAADGPVAWADANALGVPAVGLDPKGTFPPWGSPPAGDEESFLEDWRELLRHGW